MTIQSVPERLAARTAALFVALALGFSLLFWLVVALSRAGVLPFSMEKGNGFLGVSLAGTIVSFVLRGFGPAIAGVIAVASTGGRRGLAALWRSVVRWRVPAWLYVAGLFGAVINAAVVVTQYAIGATHFAVGQASLRLIPMFFLMAIFDGPLGEEIGWRGVLLPQLLARRTPVISALIVGVVWYAWHVPLYTADGAGLGVVGHAMFLYGCVALSVIFTWFFAHSGRSVFLMIYLHDCSNYFTLLRHRLFPLAGDSRLPAATYLVVLTLFAASAAIALRKKETPPLAV